MQKLNGSSANASLNLWVNTMSFDLKNKKALEAETDWW